MKKIIIKVWEVIENAVKTVLLKLFHIKITDSKWKSLMEFIKFGIVGLSNTLLSYMLYLFGLFFFQQIGISEKYDYIIAQIIAFFLSVLWSFYWNSKYVFDYNDKKNHLWKALFKTYVSYAFTGLFLNSILSVIWVQFFGWSKIYAPIINLLISVPLNFILNKFWAFKSKN